VDKAFVDGRSKHSVGRRKKRHSGDGNWDGRTGLVEKAAATNDWGSRLEKGGGFLTPGGVAFGCLGLVRGGKKKRKTRKTG